MVVGAAPLIGRKSETAILADALTAARAGRSRALVLLGDPGIGKTALLDHAAESAHGMRVLRARGVESEAELAFGGLQELLTPVLARLPRLSAHQRAVLEGAIALGPPVRGDPLAVRAATLALLSAAAEDEPLLVIVDDAQWLDPPSAASLSFAARRLEFDRTAILFAVRTAEQTSFDRSGLEVLPVPNLTDDEGRRLLESSDPGLAASVTEAIVKLARGNPLAVLELPKSLSDAERQGVEPLGPVVSVGDRLRDAFARRVDRLPADTRRALVVLAASESDDGALLARALTAGDLAIAALDAAAHSGLIVFKGGRIRFTHPLVRSIAYSDADEGQRRAAHTALAAVTGDMQDRRAWHLACAAHGPDDQVAAALELAAAGYAARGAMTGAARFMERAAQLTTEISPRAQRLSAAASMAYRGGSPRWAGAMCEEGLDLPVTTATRAQFEHLAGLVERDSGSVLQARARLWDAANKIARDDPLTATSMLIDAVLADHVGGDLRASLRTSERAVEIAQLCRPEVQTIAAGIRDISAIYRGERPLHDFDYATVSATVATAQDLPLTMLMTAQTLIIGWLIVGGHRVEPPRSAIVGELIAARRADGSLSLLPWLLCAGAAIDLREDRWVQASAQASEAVDLARHTDQGAHLAWALFHHAWIEAFRCDEASCRSHAAEALRIARTLDVGSIETYVSALLGALELGLGNFPAAVDRLEECARRADEGGLGQPEVIQYEPELVEALLGAGRDPRMRSDRLHRRAERTRSPWALATAARCRALLSDENSLDDTFVAALVLHDDVPSEFERARTQLCYGERLRRARRRVDAREQLTSALDTFDRLGARGWAERARRELQATGITARPRNDAGTVDALTARELQVVQVLAEGATVSEAAAHLFLSPKTVEAHLGRAYRKLGVHNRAQLATRLAQGVLPTTVATEPA